MSIWSRITAAISALAQGEGLAAVFDHLRAAGRPPEKSVAFTIAVIALGAKMAKADGQVTRNEVAAFRRVFTIPAEEESAAARVFNLARQDVAGFEAYAAQIAKIFAGNPALLEDVLDGLFEIAKADGVLHPCEARFLERVAEIFGFAPNEYRRIRASHFAPELTDPYVILGVDYSASDDEIRRTYLRLVRENHPDSLLARGVPLEFEKLANDKLAAINNAYEKIKAERGT